MNQNRHLSGRQSCNKAIKLWPELAQLGYKTRAINTNYKIAEGTFPKPRRLGKRSVWMDQDIKQWREQWLENDQ